MYLAPITPHVPAIPEEKYTDMPVGSYNPPGEKDRSDKPAWLRNSTPVRDQRIRYQRAKALRSLKSIDDMLGELRAKLAELGEEDTIIIFTSDNGMQWGDHGLKGKTTPYLPSVQVPLYMGGPGVIPGRHKNLVGLLDLAPTLVSLTGIHTDKVFDGRSMFGDPRKMLLLEFWSWDEYKVPTWKAYLTEGFEYIEYYRPSGRLIEREAYNLNRDRGQLNNLFGDHRPSNDPSRSKGKLLAQLASCRGASCP